MRYICTSIVATLALVGTSFAATINVPADYATIQAAVDAASNGDTVLVAPGTYTGTGDEVVNTAGKAITIKASGTPEETIIDGEGARRVITCDNNEGADTIIEGFTITGGSAGNGGGISCHASSPTITDCEISDNTANNSGGGIYCYGSSPTIADCVIQNNYCVGGGGGGVFCGHNSNPEFLNCTISGNTCPADQGGGFYFIQDCDPVLINCTISGNTCHDSPQFGNHGGGIHSNNYCHLTITGCTIAANTADDSGGGLYSGYFCDALISDTWICGNTPDQIEGSWTDGGNNTIQETCPATDEDGDGVFDNIDNCYLYNPDQADCNENGVGDVCDVADGTSYDCDQNGEPDECQPDCDGDGWIDPCDSEGDIDGDGIPDNCEDDCNDNGIPDEWEIKNGWGTDCDGNGILDECDVTTDPSLDCNANGIHDACDIADGSEEDCDGNAIPDSCQIANDSSLDCDGNGILDSCEIENDQSLDCNGNGTLDECDLGGQGPEGAVQWTVAEGGNGHWYMGVNDFVTWSTASSNAQQQGGYLATCTTVEENTFVQAVRDADTTLGGAWIGLVQLPEGSEPDGGWEWVTGEPLDWTNWTADQPNNSDNKGAEADYGEMCCHSDGWADWADGHPMPYIIEWDAGGEAFSEDCNTNGIPDECDIADGTSNDANGNGIPDECEDDCNGNGVPDHWDIKTGTSEDCNANGIPDECDTADGGGSNDVNGNSIPDECEEDCNGNGSPDDWDLVTGWSEDCNGNLIPDECDIAGEAPEGAVRWTVEEGGNGHWYQNISGTNPPDGDVGITWNDGRTDALAIGGDLASLETDEEVNWVFNQIASDPASWWYNAGENDGPYLGGFQDTTAPDYNEPGGGWYWLTGTPLQSTFWGPAQPNDSSGSQNHLHFWSPGTEIDMTFDDVGETDTGGGNAYIIEWDAGFFSFSLDCNANGVPDECDIADGTSEDINSDGVPDECQCLADIDGSGAVTIDDILAVVGYWGSSIPAGDLNYDGIVDIEDLLIVLGAWGPCP